MLAKLFKHEFQATGRIFLPLYGLLFVLSLLNKYLPTLRSISSIFSGILVVIPIILCVCLIVALSAMTLVVLVQRFSKSLLGDEGYLYHTLPVRTWQHIVCKLVTAAFWTLLNSLVITLSVLFMATDVSSWGSLWNAFLNLLTVAGEYMGSSGIAAFWSILLLIFLTVIEKTLMIYAGMGIGQCFARRKTALSICAVVALNIAEQVITVLVVSLIARITRDTNFLHDFSNGDELRFFLIFYSIFVALFGGVYAYVANWTLKKHLNLA